MRTTMKLKLTHDEVRVLVYALNELRNTLIAENRYTDAVDEILARLIAKRIILYAVHAMLPGRSVAFFIGARMCIA